MRASAAAPRAPAWRGRRLRGAHGEQPLPLSPRALARLDPLQRVQLGRALRGGGGNAALARALLAPAADRPARVTTGPDPLPAGATTAGASSARTVADPRLPGGWTDPDGRTTPSSTVGGVDRIMLEGISGRQRPQEPLAGGRPYGAGMDLADAVGPGPAGRRGRAIALVPRTRRGAAPGPVTVVVHAASSRRAPTTPAYPPLRPAGPSGPPPPLPPLRLAGPGR